MSNNNIMYNGHHDEQPGLELDSRADQTGLQRDIYAEDTAKQISPDVHEIPSGLQVAAAPGAAKEGGGYFSGKLYAESAGLEATSPGEMTYNFDQRGWPPAEATPAAAARPNRRRLWIILGAIAAVAIVAGAAVGGVLGGRAARAASSVSEEQVGTGSSSSSNGNSGESTTPRKNIRPGSRLAVTGWREYSAYHIRLFYQGPDQLLRFSNRSSMEPGWHDTPTLLDEMEYKARPNTSLAAAASVENADAGEWKLYYFDDAATIREQIFPADVKATGKSGALDNNPQTAAPNSRLGAYWPFVLSQDVGGRLRVTRYMGIDESNQIVWESSTDVGVSASPGSGLVVIPAAAKYLDAGGLVYRRGDGKVYNYLADQKGNNTGFAWASGDIVNNLKGLTIPQDAPIASFTVARSSKSDDPDHLVNTYILYADAQGAIQMLWQNDKSGWQGRRHYAAFAGAEAGTDIACLTPGAWDGSGVGIAGAYDMSRCYFQAGGAGQVREVRFDGADWKDLGYLPID
ncbi:hypothetical protein PG985_007678 [Apiospora marii]|uniref:uncharacterized protein n=1 Tax=Apiospora marii TaxID=335849 RepID=UPI0031317C51